MKKEVANDSLK